MRKKHRKTSVNVIRHAANRLTAFDSAQSSFESPAFSSPAFSCLAFSAIKADTLQLPCNLPIIVVFLEYLRQFLIDLNQIYRHSSVPKNTSP